jgi:hypothetical protein
MADVGELLLRQQLVRDALPLELNRTRNRKEFVDQVQLAHRIGDMGLKTFAHYPTAFMVAKTGMVDYATESAETEPTWARDQHLEI